MFSRGARRYVILEKVHLYANTYDSDGNVIKTLDRKNKLLYTYISSNKISFSFAQSYYIQLTGKDKKSNNLSTLKSSVLDKLSWVKLAYAFIM